MKPLSKFFFVAILLVAAGSATGSDGTESPFMFGTGARELSLGGAAVASSADATTVFWNPSCLTLAQRISVAGMHSEPLIDGAAYQYFGVVIPTLDFGSFGLGLFRQSIQNIEKRDSDNMYLGEFDDSHLRLHLGYGRRLGQINVGASLSLDHQSIDTYKATSSPGLTLSATHRFDPSPSWLTNLTVSAVVRSLLKPGIKLADETYRYPTSFDLSGSVLIVGSGSTDHSLEPSLTFRKTESIPVQLYAGMEYSYKQLLRLRTGIRQRKFSLGAGIDLGTVSFDYALVDRDLDFIHLFALTGSFGLSVDERKAGRAERQESDFRQAMNSQMQQRNLALIDELLTAGHSQLASGQYDDAAGSFDRLVFLARSAGLDEARYEKLLDSAVELRSATETAHFLKAAVDSANSNLASGDLLSARHNALRALEADSTCDEARQIFEKADQALKSNAKHSEFLSDQLARIDTLLDSRRFEQAESMIQSLIEIAPGEDAVMHRLNRLELERLRLKIANIESQRDDGAQGTAQTLAPADNTGPDGPSTARPQAAAKPLSEEERAEMTRVNEEAKQLFNDGNILAAVERWETVANRTPDFQSVREFLVKAYKFLGLELYGQKQRSEAIAVWKKALTIDPDNDDIVEYIRRAESQIKKLEELAHEQS